MPPQTELATIWVLTQCNSDGMLDPMMTVFPHPHTRAGVPGVIHSAVCAAAMLMGATYWLVSKAVAKVKTEISFAIVCELYCGWLVNVTRRRCWFVSVCLIL